MGRLAEIDARKVAIRALLEGNEKADLIALEAELKALDAEKLNIEKREAMLAGINAGTVETNKIDKPGEKTPEAEKIVEAEKRGKDLKEKRAVTVAASGIILPVYKATDIKPTFNQVSSLIDRVTTMNLNGGESFTQPYLTGYGEGDYTGENADYADAEPTFGSAIMSKAKVTSYAEDSEETFKLPAAAYDGQVVTGMTVALRKKITKGILVGTGAANQFAGIFSTAATAIDSATDIEITEIDETTLDEIIYSYGGDENVEDISVLILNKMDLKAFATLRDADGEKIYEVKNNGNTGTIDGVPFIINSACKAVSKPATNSGEFAMAYGPCANYMMAVFSGIEIQRSTDYKFKQGMICHKGVVFAGGNVTSKNGFLRVKKG